MKRALKILFLGGTAFLACVVAALLVVYGVWYVGSRDYLHAPNPSGEVRDAPAYVLLGYEMFIGLPVGVLAGIAATVLVVRKR